MSTANQTATIRPGRQAAGATGETWPAAPDIDGHRPGRPRHREADAGAGLESGSRPAATTPTTLADLTRGLVASLHRVLIPGRCAVVRVRRDSVGPYLEPECEVWAGGVHLPWERRGSIAMPARTSLPDLERAVVEAGFTFHRNDVGMPAWRTDRDRRGRVLYLLDVVRP